MSLPPPWLRIGRLCPGGPPQAFHSRQLWPRLRRQPPLPRCMPAERWEAMANFQQHPTARGSILSLCADGHAVWRPVSGGSSEAWQASSNPARKRARLSCRDRFKSVTCVIPEPRPAASFEAGACCRSGSLGPPVPPVGAAARSLLRAAAAATASRKVSLLRRASSSDVVDCILSPDDRQSLVLERLQLLCLVYSISFTIWAVGENSRFVERLEPCMGFERGA